MEEAGIWEVVHCFRVAVAIDLVEAMICPNVMAGRKEDMLVQYGLAGVWAAEGRSCWADAWAVVVANCRCPGFELSTF